MKVKTSSLAHVIATPEMLFDDGMPHIAFAGRSNIGKSSLINSLLNRRKLAYTSSTPGKTRKIYYFLVNDSFYFVDLPGYGYAKISRGERAYFKVLVDRYLEEGGNMKACVLLLDPKRPVGQEEKDFLSYLDAHRIAAIVVFTRGDRVRSAKRHKMLRERKEELSGGARDIHFVSARSREGIDRLWQSLEKKLGGGET